ncbi:MAG: MBL fold metallo-hydrolase [Deltaproteobacteria bacterium]|nr:MBL fold metallo-hydrolase [Deltaproteobacteria bacterium]
MESKRSRFVLIFLACLGLTGWTAPQDFNKIQIQSVRVAEGVYLLYGEGGNIGVSAGADGILLVDSQFGELHEKIKTALAEFCHGPIRFVLNTNGHYDHALGNEVFRNDGAIIVAHENARKRMMTEQIHDIINEKTPPYRAGALPEATFAESLVLHLNGEDIQAIHVVNAHSDSDALYWFRKANVIHTGDVFFSDGYPYIDIGNGGSVNGMIAAADKIIGMSDEKTEIIPGHGRLSDRKRLREYRAMLATVRDRVAKMIKEGKRLEEIVALKPTASLDKDWTAGVGVPAEMFVTIVYKDLSR